MPATYNGNPALGSWLPAIPITEPSDGDARNVASVNTALSTLADFIAFLQANAGWVNPSWDGSMFPRNASSPSGADDWIMIWHAEAVGESALYVRCYRSTTGFFITYNASFVGGGTSLWYQDDGAIDSVGLAVNANGVVIIRQNSGVASWATAGWLYGTSNAGRFVADTAKSSATPGAGQTVVHGEIYKDGAVAAWADVTVNTGTGAITVNRSYNCTSITRSSTGLYVVTLASAPANRVVPVACCAEDPSTLPAFAHARQTAPGVVTVNVRNDAGSAADASFNLIVMGG